MHHGPRAEPSEPQAVVAFDAAAHVFLPCMSSRETEQKGYIMRFVMNPDMVYRYPIWSVGLLLVGAAVFGAALLELFARRLLPIELRQRHNDVAAAIFSIIGVTYAVLLTFVAMLAWEGFNRANAASYAEATVIGDVYHLSAGFADPEKSSIRNEILEYARRVATVEWPAQAEGRMVDQDFDLPQRIEQDGAHSSSVRPSRWRLAFASDSGG